ncbi:MAG: RNA polymerase sigma factor, partial [Bacteroidetes bacterium]|nr:RNA polymerase sigma factor [Bacteroidota bacterium]
MKTSAAQKISDEHLVAMYRNGDTGILGILYERYSAKVYNKCWTFVKNYDEAYDLAHDIMLRVFEKIDTFRGDATFSTWLYSVTFNHCTEHYRKAKRYSTVDVDGCWNLSD